MFKRKFYSLYNTAMEVTLGFMPMYVLFRFSNDMVEFRQKVENYFPSEEIQLLFVYYFLFGFIILLLNSKFTFSKHILVPSTEFISAFISLGQALTGLIMFITVQLFLLKAYKYAIAASVTYYVFHVIMANMSIFLNYLKHKYRWGLTHE
ncbi:hypothetical protein [Pelotalea chapellei]|uniref:Tic20 family protein Ycf60 n=1 Tax=Pelotalea chapellei TaxID=44671 RepID=A0ABS5UCR0_9BACT|nr:hypothetical protein [Pelotalea chapellei]MBT1073482.1 hypothetical protein [Pelotalea chapellei]